MVTSSDLGHDINAIAPRYTIIMEGACKQGGLRDLASRTEHPAAPVYTVVLEMAAEWLRREK